METVDLTDNRVVLKKDHDMNAAQKKRLNEIIGLLEGLASEVREIADSEQERFDNLGEKAQEGERGEAIQETASQLEALADGLTEAAEAIPTIIEEARK